ncbi:hypothetical protein K466DRAFT_666093 [Polyporus arcularius HHB13444]|uniref:Uncharacterized protein n=1 Tax=Polyporus arcularius HHB13444 TaxID=1314778 RepID=A0A5C3P390_9APHY|nr:hypothetical protein K466DRAFT_666093 [Polyporus arcularius HHB13444]
MHSPSLDSPTRSEPYSKQSPTRSANHTHSDSASGTMNVSQAPSAHAATCRAYAPAKPSVALSQGVQSTNNGTAGPPSIADGTARGVQWVSVPTVPGGYQPTTVGVYSASSGVIDIPGGKPRAYPSLEDSANAWEERYDPADAEHTFVVPGEYLHSFPHAGSSKAGRGGRGTNASTGGSSSSHAPAGGRRPRRAQADQAQRSSASTVATASHTSAARTSAPAKAGTPKSAKKKRTRPQQT